MENAASFAVNGLPSENVTFGCSWKVYTVRSADSVQLLARHGTTSPVAGSRSTRVWYTLPSSSCGACAPLCVVKSRLVGSNTSPSLRVPLYGLASPFVGLTHGFAAV